MKRVRERAVIGGVLSYGTVNCGMSEAFCETVRRLQDETAFESARRPERSEEADEL